MNPDKIKANESFSDGTNSGKESVKRMKQTAPYLFPLLVLLVFTATIVTYSNHFCNSFHFDDDHCIVNNAWIRNLHFIPQYFKTATTFSSLPMNQTYRPMLTVLYALSYHFGGLDVFYYHLPVFIFFLLTGTLIFLVAFKLFNMSSPSDANPYFALFACGWYLLAAANSDTINYISSSSDSISTFFVWFALTLFIYFPERRKWMLYLIPIVIGALFKQTAIVFPAILGAYLVLFEMQPNHIPAAGTNHSILKLFRLLFPSLMLCIILYLLQKELTPPAFVTGGIPFYYYITQPFAALIYFLTFYIPVGISADSGWDALTSMHDSRFWAGVIFLGMISVLFIIYFRRKKYAPAIFGLAFFFIALLPTSLVPLAEATNDHRAFFPNTGLAIASSWLLCLGWQKSGDGKVYKVAAICFTALILSCNAFATYYRNKVWKNEESLWYDVTLKSPDNARGLMNYGRTQLINGNYAAAEEYLLRAAKMAPCYSYVYANLGVLKEREHQDTLAENYFQRAMLYGSNIPVILYTYAVFLHSKGDNGKAIELLRKCINTSPADINSRRLAMRIYLSQKDWIHLGKLAQETLVLLPGDSEAEQDLAAARKGQGQQNSGAPLMQ